MLSALFALSLAVPGSQAGLFAAGFLEWFWLSSIVVDDYLYITGGEFYMMNETSMVSYLTDTITIDLTQSWTNATVAAAGLEAAPDNMVLVRQPILYYDEPRNKISMYGGWPYLTTDFSSNLWSFTAGSNAVSWENETSPAMDGLSSNSPGPFASANAFTNSTFYNVGGNVITPNGLPNMTVLSGLVTRDLVGESWVNSTAEIPNQNKYRTQARAQFVPNFGGKGFIIVVGGEAPPTEVSFYEQGIAMVDMATITLYDIEAGTWHTQTATGDIPPPRSEFCTVGSVSQDGQYFELFVYGGSTNATHDLNNASEQGYLNVYALSLPAFQWFKSPSTTPVRRACHTCSVIGRRQMISIGGRLPSSLLTLGSEPDPWADGIGIFDMTAFEWADHYNAAADPYDSPTVVKEYYAHSYQEPKWGDTRLASMFAYERSGNFTSPTDPSGGNGNGSTSTSNHAGLIAGAVVGGTALIAFLAAVGYLLWRRRNRARAAAVLEGNEGERSPMKPAEALSIPRYEAHGNSRSELDSPSIKHQTIAELPATDHDFPRAPAGR